MRRVEKQIKRRRRDLSHAVTVFVTTVGDEPNYRECRICLARQSVDFRLEVIAHVTPMSAAFQRMHDLCRTRYYVQVDEDMLLRPDAVERLHALIEHAPPKVAMICATLWDHEIREPIYGVKIFKHAIVRQFRFENSFACDRTQLLALQAAGYAVTKLPRQGRAGCFGEHGKHFTPRSIFVRWPRLLQKHRRYQNIAWAEKWPRQLLLRCLTEPTPRRLYAFLGAVAGIVGELPPNQEYDARVGSPDFDRLSHALGDFERLQRERQ